MRAVYSALDVLCLSSIREGNPFVVAEAMACGTPCVVTDAGEAPSIVGDTGAVVPVGAPEPLSDALERALTRLGEVRPENLRARVERHASIEASVDGLEAALEEVRDGLAPRRGAEGSSRPR